MIHFFRERIRWAFSERIIIQKSWENLTRLTNKSSMLMYETMSHKNWELTKKHIAVVIPAYRVEKKILKVVASIPEFVRTIIVVDDASPDDTFKILQGINDPRLFIFRHERNQGVGGAMITGYNRAVEAGAEIMVKIDGDDQMDPSHMSELILPIINGFADYTKGNRFLHRKQLQKMPLIRQIGNWGLTFLCKAASGYWNIFDPSNGYTAIHADVWKLINTENIAKDYFFEASMLIELRFSDAVVRDVYIPARYEDEESSLSISNVLLTFPWRLFLALAKRFIYKYYLYNFSYGSLAFILGLIFLGFGGIWGIVHWRRSVITGVPATTGTVLIAVLPIILGIQLILQVIEFDISDVPRSALHQNLQIMSSFHESEDMRDDKGT